MHLVRAIWQARNEKRDLFCMPSKQAIQAGQYGRQGKQARTMYQETRVLISMPSGQAKMAGQDSRQGMKKGTYFACLLSRPRRQARKMFQETGFKGLD